MRENKLQRGVLNVVVDVIKGHCLMGEAHWPQTLCCNGEEEQENIPHLYPLEGPGRENPGVTKWRRRARSRGAWKDVLRQAEMR